MKDKVSNIITVNGKTLTANVQLFTTLAECVKSAQSEAPIVNKLNNLVTNSVNGDALVQLDSIVQSVSKVAPLTKVAEAGPKKGKTIRDNTLDGPKQYITRVLTAQPELIDQVQAEMSKKPIVPLLNRVKVAGPKKVKAPNKSQVKKASELLAAGGATLQNYLALLSKAGLGNFTSGPNAEENVAKLAPMVQALQALTK